MRRIKIILATVAAVATMVVMAAPAMAQTVTPASIDVDGNTFSGGGIVTDSGLIGGNFDSGSDGFSFGPFGTDFDDGNGVVCVCPGANSVEFA
jgi:hypothetical protein